jgi:hypothetical protein
MAQLQTNSFVYNGQKVLYENCHYFNHSCAPNACLYEHENYEATVHVIEPIKFVLFCLTGQSSRVLICVLFQSWR